MAACVRGPLCGGEYRTNNKRRKQPPHTEQGWIPGICTYFPGLLYRHRVTVLESCSVLTWKENTLLPHSHPHVSNLLALLDSSQEPPFDRCLGLSCNPLGSLLSWNHLSLRLNSQTSTYCPSDLVSPTRKLGPCPPRKDRSKMERLNEKPHE